MTITLPQGVTSNKQQCGSVGGTPIYAELGMGLFPYEFVKVTLSANYLLSGPPTWLTARPDGQNSSAGDGLNGRYLPGQTILSGATVLFHRPEADALIAAGYATLVGSVSSVPPFGTTGSE